MDPKEEKQTCSICERNYIVEDRHNPRHRRCSINTNSKRVDDDYSCGMFVRAPLEWGTNGNPGDPYDWMKDCEGC